MTTQPTDDAPAPSVVPGGWWRRWWPWMVTATVGLSIAAGLRLGGHPNVAVLVLILLSTGLSASSAIPSILASRADPASLEPVTWAIWCALTATAGVASAVKADYPSAVFAAVGTATCGGVAIVSLRRGRRTFSAANAVCCLIAAAGVIGWLTADRASVAVLAACLGDLAALFPTIRHAWQHPDQEPTATFVLIAGGGLCTAGAAWGQWTVTALAYPLYVAASTAAVAVLTLRRPPTSVAPAPPIASAATA